LTFRICAKLSSYAAIFQLLPQAFQHITAELRPCIQEDHALVRPRHLARHRHVPPADQPRIRDGVMRGATRAGGDPRRAIPREASDAREVGGVDRCGQAR